MLKTLKPPAPTAVDDQEYRDALRHFASGVTVISTLDSAGRVHGMTATAFSSLSLRPPLVLVAVDRRARCHRQVITTRQFGVSILHSRQEDLSRHFGGRPLDGHQPTFSRLDGAPVLEDAMVTLACTLDSTLEGGDHTIFVGLVTATTIIVKDPLVHFAGAYYALSKDIK